MNSQCFPSQAPTTWKEDTVLMFPCGHLVVPKP